MKIICYPNAIHPYSVPAVLSWYAALSTSTGWLFPLFCVYLVYQRKVLFWKAA